MGIAGDFWEDFGAPCTEAPDSGREFEPKGAGESRKDADGSSSVPMSFRTADKVLGLKIEEVVAPYVVRFTGPRLGRTGVRGVDVDIRLAALATALTRFFPCL